MFDEQSIDIYNGFFPVCPLARGQRMTKRFSRFKDFYPFYLEHHRDPMCRRLHVFGTAAALLLVIVVLIWQQWIYLWLLPLLGYGPAWIGHFYFEHNQPATLRHPWYSLLADWMMMKDILTGKIKF